MPPTPLTFHILLALAKSEQVALEVAEQITKDTQGTMIVSSGAFYKALGGMVREGLIEQGK